MREQVSVAGMVLKSSPVGEYDRRLVILSRERGKITAFARGARRPGSPLMACSCPFVFGNFFLYEGRDAYTLVQAEIQNYFREIAEDMEAACYGSYFLEFSDYYARENIEALEPLKLLYQSLRALMKPSLPNPLVRRIFELKTMVFNGEYTQLPQEQVSDSCTYAWEYVVLTPPEELYRFALKEPVLKEFERCVERARRRFLPHPCRSLEILETLTG